MLSDSLKEKIKALFQGCGIAVDDFDDSGIVFEFPDGSTLDIVSDSPHHALEFYLETLQGAEASMDYRRIE